MKPQWQRALIVEPDVPGSGRLVWTRCGALDVTNGIRLNGEPEPNTVRVVWTNVTRWGQLIKIDCAWIELLDEFAADVPTIEWNEFRGGSK